jgi:enamine deaminase RidA (YjgF/YER057c/UK114 family)
MQRKLISSGSPFEKAAGYSRAVVVGEWCFVSGTTGYDYATMSMPDDAAAQTRNALGTIRRALEEGGFALSDLVRMQYTATDVSLVDEIFAVLGEALGEIRPAATIVIAGLIKPEMKVEIEATAYRPKG